MSPKYTLLLENITCDLKILFKIIYFFYCDLIWCYSIFACDFYSKYPLFHMTFPSKIQINILFLHMTFIIIIRGPITALRSIADIPKLSHYCADHLSIIYSILSHRYTKLIGFD